MMDCAAFENRLTEVLAGELDAVATRAALVELERHTERCSNCASAAPWVELAALPPAERDPLPEPPDGYWRGFDAAVARRVAGQRPGSWARGLAAAAAIVLALAAGWFLRGRLLPGPGDDVVAGLEQEASAEWSPLEEAIRAATPEELAEALSNLPANGDGFQADLGDEWMPDTDELDEIDQEQLMEWLDQLDQKEGRSTS